MRIWPHLRSKALFSIIAAAINVIWRAPSRLNLRRLGKRRAGGAVGAQALFLRCLIVYGYKICLAAPAKVVSPLVLGIMFFLVIATHG